MLLPLQECELSDARSAHDLLRQFFRPRTLTDESENDSMATPRPSKSRLKDLEKLLGQEHLSPEIRILGTVLVDVCQQLDRLVEHNVGQDEILRPEEHRRI